MRLHLTSHELWDCMVYSPSGQVVYKILQRSQVSTIWRALPNLQPTSAETLWTERHFPSLEDHHDVGHHPPSILEVPRRPSSECSDPPFNWGKPGSPRPDRSSGKVVVDFAKVAEIEFHTLLATKIRFMGEEWTSKDFFRKGEGQGRIDRAFTGSDGREYLWTIVPHGCELYVTADNRSIPTLVARLYNTPPASERTMGPPSLDIFPSAEHMSDLIVSTAVYIERLRRNGS